MRIFKIICLSLVLIAVDAALVFALHEKIVVTGFDSPQLVKGIPPGWVLDQKKGSPSIRLVKTGDSYYLHLYSNKSAFGIKKGLKVDVREYPYLNWEWAVSKLPKGGDIRKSGTDDQALQIYIAFPATGWPDKLNTPVLCYVWDNEAPKELAGRSPQIGGGRLRYYVVKNKTDMLNQWYTEKRNIYEDYKRLFKDINGGEPTGPTVGVEIYINTQHTGSQAEGYINNMFFSRN